MGVIYLILVRFPFLMFPVSASLWYLSMDLPTAWIQHIELPSEDQAVLRSRISTAMGVILLLLGYATELICGSDPDVAFWLYFFGLLTFSIATFRLYRSSDVYGSVYLLTFVSLVLIGSRLGRVTFCVFGAAGVIEYTVALFMLKIRSSGSVGLWLLKGLAAAVLFATAIREKGTVEVYVGMACVLAFNFKFCCL